MLFSFIFVLAFYAGELINMLGPWKRKCLSEFGIVTQCIAPTRVNDQYLTNVLLKINAKVDLLVLSILFGLVFLIALKLLIHFGMLPVMAFKDRSNTWRLVKWHKEQGMLPEN